MIMTIKEIGLIDAAETFIKMRYTGDIGSLEVQDDGLAGEFANDAIQ